MRWLFRFNVGGERQTGSKSQAQGLGHAMRCLSLAQEFKKSYDGSALFLVEGAADFCSYFDQVDIPFLINEDERKVLDDFRPTTIIIDINYLNKEQIMFYRRWAPVVNLAPRGLPKFYANATFNNIAALDIPIPPEISNVVWFRGPQYAVVGQKFIRLREQLDDIDKRWEERTVVICMGGIDYHNVTKAIMQNFSQWQEDLMLKIIIGPLYPHEDELHQLLSDCKLPNKVMKDPPDIAREIVEARLGIFGAGIITYEALSVGVPSISVSLTQFHKLVCEELSALGVAVYGGIYDQLNTSSLREMVSELLFDHKRLDEMRCRALKLVDGLGSRRIVNKVVELFGKS